MTKQRSKASLVVMALFLIATTLAAQVTEEWVARYDGPANEYDGAYAIAIDGAGNVYVTGWSYGSGTYEDYTTIKCNVGSIMVDLRRNEPKLTQCNRESKALR